MSNELVQIGYVIKTHGVQGHLRIAFDENIKELSEQEALYFLVKGNQIPFFIKTFSYFKNGDALVLLEEITNKEDAERFTKKAVSGPDSYVEEEEEEFEDPWVDFIVTDEVIGLLGKVNGSIDMVEYVLLEIDYLGKTIMIPVHDEVIVALDESKKELITRLPAGILDI